MLKVRQQIGGLGNLLFKQAYLYAQARRGEIPDVYVQSDKYWKDYAEEIRQMFGEGITAMPNIVSLHIRRGDYLDKNGFYVDLTKTDYYQKAVKYFPGKQFLVFYKDRQGRDGKDKEYAKEFMDTLGVDYSLCEKDQDETEDMNLMASCEGHIMANSSFSWWAAFLGGGKTICPAKWFTDGVQRCDLLDSWIQI